MDVIVIGAGIVGASTAYHLARSGHQVALVDKRREGEATAAGAGIVAPWLSKTKTPAHTAMTRRGAAYYPQLLAALAEDGFTDTGYERCSAMRLVTDTGERRRMAEALSADPEWSEHIGTVSELDGPDTQAAVPPLADGWSAVHVTGAGRVEARKLRDVLVRAAQHHGARVRADLAEIEDVPQGAQVRFEDTDTIRGDVLVVASGAWAREVVAPLGTALSLQPQRGQILHVGMPGENTGSWPVVLPESSHYLAPFTDERVVVGATRETGSGFDYRLTVGGVKEVLDHAVSVAPGLATGSIRDMRIGFRPMAPDQLPLLGSLDSLDQKPQVVIATGMGASGITMGPYVGKLAADLTVGVPVAIDLTPYDPLRNV